MRNGKLFTLDYYSFLSLLLKLMLNQRHFLGVQQVLPNLNKVGFNDGKSPLWWQHVCGAGSARGYACFEGFNN